MNIWITLHLILVIIIGIWRDINKTDNCYGISSMRRASHIKDGNLTRVLFFSSLFVSVHTNKLLQNKIQEPYFLVSYFFPWIDKSFISLLLLYFLLLPSFSPFPLLFLHSPSFPASSIFNSSLSTLPSLPSLSSLPSLPSQFHEYLI